MAEAQQDPQPVFTIEKIYVKDLSIEVPNAPQIFLERDTPRVDVQMSTKASPVDDSHYEVVLSVTTTASLNDKTVFLVEAHQAAIFQVRNLPKHHILLLLSTPVDDVTSLFTFVVWRNDDFTVPADEVLRFDKAIGAEDRRMLERVPGVLPLDATALVSVQADKASVEWRRQLAGLLAAAGEPDGVVVGSPTRAG